MNKIASLAVGRAGIVAAAALGVACSGSSVSRTRTHLSPRQIAEKSKPAIVRVESATDAGAGVGTGFIVSADGRIATNLHVIHGAARIQVTLLDGTKLPVSEVVAIDPERDLAIVSVKPTQQLPTLNIGDSDDVSAGDRVIAIGNPLGVLDYTVSDGLISSVRLLNRSLTVLQISAPISQGSSGGPLFNNFGEVIGIATAIIGEGQNLNFGIPSNYLRPLIAKGRTEAVSVAEFSKKFAPPEGETGGQQPRIRRQIPDHDVSILAGCPEAAVEEAVTQINEAIKAGAPLYNSGNHEACFRIYEGTTIRLERELNCKGLREALGQGLLRVSTLETHTEKAWALRDTFDGIIKVVIRSQQGK